MYNNINQPITSGNMHTCSSKLNNVLTYAITDITTWGADMPHKVGHVRTRAYVTFSNLSVLHGGNESTIMAHYDRQV